MPCLEHLHEAPVLGAIWSILVIMKVGRKIVSRLHLLLHTVVSQDG